MVRLRVTSWQVSPPPSIRPACLVAWLTGRDTWYDQARVLIKTDRGSHKMRLKMTRLHRNWFRDLKPRLLARRLEVGGKGDTQSPTMINCVLDLHICRLACSQWSTVISWLWPWDVSDWQPPVPPFTDTPHRYLLGGGHGSHAGAGLDLRKLHSRHQDSTGSRGGFISDLKKQFLSSAGDVSPPAELVVGGGWWSGGAASPPDWGSVSAMLSWVLCSQQPAAATS